MSMGKLAAVFVKSALAFQKKGAGLHGIVGGMCEQYYDLYEYVLQVHRERKFWYHVGDFAEHLGLPFCRGDVVH